MIKTAIKDIVKKSPKLYTLCYCLRYMKDPDFQNLIRGANGDGAMVLQIDGNYEVDEDIYYFIDWGIDNKDWDGFFALVRHSIRRLYIAKCFHLKPCLVWGSGTVYYDSCMDGKTCNVFEYYFKPIAPDYNKILSEGRYVRYRWRDFRCIPDGPFKELAGYEVGNKELDILASIYKEFFSLNDSTQTFISKDIKKLFSDGEKVIGVQVRGTDFKKRFKGHPEFKGFQPFIDAVKEVMNKGNYKKVFLATEDEEALELFIKEFGDNVVFYADCERAHGDISIVMNKGVKPYEMGLQVLRDVYTLIECDAFVYGMSQVAFAALYIKKSRGEEFLVTKEINMEINKDGREPVDFYGRK